MKKFVLGADKPTPAIYNERGVSINYEEHNHLTDQAKWDKAGITTDSESEYEGEIRIDHFQDKKLFSDSYAPIIAPSRFILFDTA